VVGANGAGKSTLLLHLTGCLLPGKGVLNVGGTAVTRQTLARVRRTVGLVFQDPDDQLFMPTVAEDVAFGPLNLGLPGDEIDRRVTQALETVNAGRLAEKAPYHLSGGEKRAVAIASVLAMDPEVLVMDEPSASLDPRARRALIGLLKGLDHTLIVATHDLDLALDVCDRTIVLKQGRVLADGATRTVLTDDALLGAAGLERPLRLQGCPICAGR
jgi:cobalt/nickel transport system ATP-binding protein